MAYNAEKELKLYYSIGEVAGIFGVTETLLRYWEKEFPTVIAPRKTGRNIRQYTKEDIEFGQRKRDDLARGTPGFKRE